MEDLFTWLDNTPPEPAPGPLQGKTVVVQPNMSVQDRPTGAGTKALSGYVALADATLVGNLRRAGAVLRGAGRMSELGFGLNGDTAAQIIERGLADIVLVTDTLGEARAAGVAGKVPALKPSYGIVSRCGLVGLVPSMECCGILARTFEDIAETLRALAGADPKDPSMDADGAGRVVRELEKEAEPAKGMPVLGRIAPVPGLPADPYAAAFEAALSRLAAAGVGIREIELTDRALVPGVHQVIGSVEASSSAGKYDGVRYGHRADAGRNWNEMYLLSRKESFGPAVKSYLFQGGYFQYKNYDAFVDACRVRARLVRETEAALETVDAILAPAGTGAGQGATAGEVYDAFGPTLLASLTGQPALVLPDPAAPGGLQLIGKRLGDARLLRAGQRISDLLSGDTPS
jgi:aspartyl-tRNA(Asn)/glutamyl-tRNA(Gln) amidotransferase subunit A